MPDPTSDLYPPKRNETYTLDRPITDEKVNGNYNNFYEFGSQKTIASTAQALKTRPWMIKIDGLVEKPFEIGIDDLIRKVGIEERTYRHRCVEAWSMAIAWSGFPLAKLVKLARPLGSAKISADADLHGSQDRLRAEADLVSLALYRRGLRWRKRPTILAFLATGAYGHPIAKQHGAPIRLAVPWKYGFKSVKSIVHFTFTDQRPKTYWEALQAQEYGFWANVNPEVPHPRWSQASEEVIGHRGTAADDEVQRLRRIRRRSLQRPRKQRAAVGISPLR
ncbi:MAG: protein-methionine-sulfoxide reductase catalytic subunit MsrP [Pseudolabrys sp.]